MSAFWTDCYRAHFQRYFSKPFDIQVFHDPRGFALKIAIHDQAGRNYGVYASLGLADKLADRDEDDFGEVILCADVRDPEVPQIFVNTLFFILRNDIPIGSRFSIGGIDRFHVDFSRRYNKSALYFTLALNEDERFNKVRNGADFGRVYQALFISSDEEAFLEQHGPDAFEKRLHAQARSVDADQSRRERPIPDVANEPDLQDQKVASLPISVRRHSCLGAEFAEENTHIQKPDTGIKKGSDQGIWRKDRE